MLSGIKNLLSTNCHFHLPAIFLPRHIVQVQRVGFPALDEIPNKVRTAAELQRQHLDWTVHQTATQVDWMFCLPGHQTGTADPAKIIAIN